MRTKIASILFSIILLVFNVSLFKPVDNTNSYFDTKYYSCTTYFDTSGAYVEHTDYYYYDTYDMYDIHLERLFPNYGPPFPSNSCAPMAGAMVIGYFDYTCPDIIPNFVAGYYYNGKFRYRPHNANIDELVENLYTQMGTNTEAPGTSVNQFKNGLTKYSNSQGYSVNYNNCGKSLDKIKESISNNLPVVLFVNSFDYFPEVGVDKKDGTYTMIGRKFSVGHVLVAFGYRQFQFYKEGQPTITKNFLVVSFGNDTQGYLDVDSVSCIDEAYGINIY